MVDWLLWRVDKLRGNIGVAGEYGLRGLRIGIGWRQIGLLQRRSLLKLGLEGVGLQVNVGYIELWRE